MYVIKRLWISYGEEKKTRTSIDWFSHEYGLLETAIRELFRSSISDSILFYPRVSFQMEYTFDVDDVTKQGGKPPLFWKRRLLAWLFFSADFFYVSIMLTENEWWRNEDTNGTMLISHTIQMKDDQHRGTGFVVKIERERERTYIRQMDKW